jgi:tellurite resistance protein TerC
MLAGASWEWWVGFHVAIAFLLMADSFMPGHRHQSRHPTLSAWLGAGTFVLVAAGFALWIAFSLGRQPALEFVAGYTIETSLSIDNLFVFLVLFEGFRITRQRQHTALAWGVWGAIVLRALFICLGVTLLRRYVWITWLFGAFLLYAAIKLLRGGSTRAVIPEWIRRLQPARGSLLPVIIAVEVTDVLFATDSIPAILAVTHNPFIAYTSNIAAVLGLRTLYFALADMLDRFRFLHYGLGALLGFVALKMLLARWIEIPILASLVIIGLILGAIAAAGALVGNREHGPGARD